MSGEKPKTKTEVEVLYQRLGGKWYAFSVVNDEVFFGTVEGEEYLYEEPKTDGAPRPADSHTTSASACAIIRAVSVRSFAALACVGIPRHPTMHTLGRTTLFDPGV